MSRSPTTRRLALQALSLAALLPAPARASRAELEQAILAHTGGVRPQDSPADGTAQGLQLDIAPLIENGNAVPVRLSAPAGTRSLALFNELNPQREVVVARFGPGQGATAACRLATRIRLATSQELVAVAQLDEGRWWACRVRVIVTLAACVEGG